MTNYLDLEQQLTAGAQLVRRPVAIAFLEAPPNGVTKFEGAEPASCAFWRLASEGRTFYTLPGDHWNCPIGSYTHNTPLPPEREPELNQTLTLMSGLGYVKMEEIPQVFRLSRAPAAICYAPLGQTPVEPDLALFAGRAGSVMLLMEAALRAGVTSDLPLLARPTCMALAAALERGAVASAGCIGNRVYTGIGDDELYAVVRGRDLERLGTELDVIASANARLAEYHRERRRLFSGGASS